MAGSERELSDGEYEEPDDEIPGVKMQGCAGLGEDDLFTLPRCFRPQPRGDQPAIDNTMPRSWKVFLKGNKAIVTRLSKLSMVGIPGVVVLQSRTDINSPGKEDPNAPPTWQNRLVHRNIFTFSNFGAYIINCGRKLK